jgi:hypothetical protein
MTAQGDRFRNFKNPFCSIPAITKKDGIPLRNQRLLSP